jgi:hypothetical protein
MFFHAILALLVAIPAGTAAGERDPWRSAWTALEQEAPSTNLTAWPCLESTAALAARESGRQQRAAESLREAEAFLHRVERWSDELRPLSPAALEPRLQRLLAVRDAAAGSFCYGNLVVADTLTRVVYVATLERGVVEPEAFAGLAPTIERLRANKLPLDKIEALSAAEAGLSLPPSEPDCDRSAACFRARLEAVRRGLAEKQREDLPRTDDLGAYSLLREPRLDRLLFRMLRTDELVTVGLPLLADYARQQPPKPGGLQGDVPEAAFTVAGDRYGSELSHLFGAPSALVSSLIKDTRSGAIAFQRGFDFSWLGLVAARAGALQAEVVLDHPSISQFEPAPLALRLKNPGEPFAIVRPAALPTGAAQGPAYPVTVRAHRQGHAEVSGLQLAPPGRAEEHVRLGSWLLLLPSGDLEIPLAVSAARDKPSEPLFAEPGIYSLSVEYRPVPASKPSEGRIGELSLRAAGTAELTVRALSGPDLACWQKISPSANRWVIYDPDGAYIHGTKTPDLEAARDWVKGLRPGCAESFLRRYLDFARLVMDRELADRSGTWHPDAARLALLEALAQSPDFSFRHEAQALLDLAKQRQPRQ